MEPTTTAGVLVVGDLNPDLILTGDVVPRFGQVEQLVEHSGLLIGGSAAITAHGLARLDRPVHLLAAVGDDAFGALLRRELAVSGVGVDQVLVRDDVATGLTVVLSRGDDRAILTAPGAISTLTGAEIRATAEAPLPSGIGHVHVASLFLQPQLVPELADVLAGLRQLGLTVSLDTNDDPSGRWAGVVDLLDRVDVLLVNRREACALAGGDDVRSAAQVLADAGPLVVVKDGAAGAFAQPRDGAAVVVAGTPVDAVDSTGAGDTFNAAFVDAWLDGLALEGCLRRAVRAGACAVTAPGGTAGQPTRVELDAGPHPTPMESPR